MFWLHALSHKQCVAVARAFHESDGHGLIFCHPFDLAMPGPDGLASEGKISFRERYNTYLTRLKASFPLLNLGGPFSKAVGILFEAVCDRQIGTSKLSSWRLSGSDRHRIHKRLTVLQEWDGTSREWLLVPTNFSNATPFIQSWQNTLNALRELGLRRAAVGGCYHATFKARPLAAEIAYSCVAHLAQELREHERFDSVEVYKDLVCDVEVSPF